MRVCYGEVMMNCPIMLHIVRNNRDGAAVMMCSKMFIIHVNGSLYYNIGSGLLNYFIW